MARTDNGKNVQHRKLAVPVAPAATLFFHRGGRRGAEFFHRQYYPEPQKELRLSRRGAEIFPSRPARIEFNAETTEITEQRLGIIAFTGKKSLRLCVMCAATICVSNISLKAMGLKSLRLCVLRDVKRCVNAVRQPQLARDAARSSRSPFWLHYPHGSVLPFSPLNISA